MLISYMDVNFNKYSNVSFITFVYTVFISSKNHIQVLSGSSNAGAALVKTITSGKHNRTNLGSKSLNKDCDSTTFNLTYAILSANFILS